MNTTLPLDDAHSVRLLTAALAAASDAVMIARADARDADVSGDPSPLMRVVYVNPAFTSVTGYQPEDVLGRDPGLLLGPASDPVEVDALRVAARSGRPWCAEMLNYRRDGTPRWMEINISPIEGVGGPGQHWVSVLRDVHSRHTEIAELKAHESWFRLLFEDSPAAMWVMDRETTQFLSVNSAAVNIYGWSREQFLRMRLVDVCEPTDSGEILTRVRSGADERKLIGPYHHVTKAGEMREVMVQRQPLDFFGQPAVFVAVWDVSDAMQVRRELERRQTRLAELAVALRRRTDELADALRLARLGTWRWHHTSDRMEWSDELYAMFGKEIGGIAPLLADRPLLGVAIPEDRPVVEAALDRLMETRARAEFEFRGEGPGGEIRHFWVEARYIAGHDHEDEVIGLCQDITARKRAEEALAEAEKLSAIAQITGGVAHDFNNLLTVISLNLEMLLEILPVTDQVREFVEPALSAAQSGADLTSSLLSFARRQPLRPESIEVDPLLERVREFATRSIGVAYRIDLHGAPGLWSVRADRTQLETAVLNLLLNARDAMPGGGTIGVAAANLALDQARAESWGVPLAGDYVVISVSDHGTGIPPEVLPLVFEPFFTTKSADKGTGLGLSMVIGFAKQSGGHAALYSEPGRGTVARIYLPRLDGVRASLAAPALDVSRLKGVRMLLVEDKPDVRATVASLAHSLGVLPTPVATAEEAVVRLGTSERFDVLLTDVVLGDGMNGVDLSALARRMQPGLRVLRMSGFNEVTMGKNGAGEPDRRLLVKPFGRDAFAASLTALLAAEPG